jgi:large subunit ribosomal protein L6e
MAKGGKARGVRVTRNPEIVPGVRRFGRALASQRKATYKFSKKGLGKSTAHVTPKRADKTEGRFYASDDTKVPLRSSKGKAQIAKLRKSIRPGTVVIILAGRFRGKRVIVLKQLKQSGLLLVTGPYKINGVPLRRLNQAYVIATSTSVDVSKVDVSKIDDTFFARKADRVAKKDGEAFFAKDPKKTVVSAQRKTETARVDTAIKAIVKATPSLKQYLNAKFTLTRGQKPHQMKF